MERLNHLQAKTIEARNDPHEKQNKFATKTSPVPIPSSLDAMTRDDRDIRPAPHKATERAI
jgi:hypothetical protein